MSISTETLTAESQSNASQCTTTNSPESKEQCELDISATEQAMERQARENVEEQLTAREQRDKGFDRILLEIPY